MEHFMMFSLPIWRLLIVLYFICSMAEAFHQTTADFEENFDKYEKIQKPRVLDYPGKLSERYKRNIHASYPDITLKIWSSQRQFTLDLYLNLDLFASNYFEKTDDEIDKPIVEFKKDLLECHYKGVIRGSSHSRAAISTCQGLISGVIIDGNVTYFLENARSKDYDSFPQYYLMKSDDLKLRNYSCGFSDLHKSNDVNFEEKRKKRSLEIRGPQGSNPRSRYVELLLVIDKLQFNKLAQNKTRTFLRYKQLANMINLLYEPLNIYIVLTGIIIWTKTSKIPVSSDGGKTLDRFLSYRSENLLTKYPNDNAQLITGVKFTNSVVGKAVKNSICTSKYSGGVNMDHGTVGIVAATVAHEMGHNFGLGHDEGHCECEAKKCIMTSITSSSLAPKHWSSCSKRHFSESNNMLDFCLYNKPNKILGPVCGNGFKEEGEECDCGKKKTCKCCDPVTCKLLHNAKCATGACCNLDTCSMEHLAHVCRPAKTECDLPEYCNGKSEFCPGDFYVQDGAECQNGKSYCADGKCKTLKDQCNLLWGFQGTEVDDECFGSNVRGDEFGNCGNDHSDHSYHKCSKNDVKCGMMQCINNEGRLKLGGKVTKHLASVTIRSQHGKKLKCRSVIVDYGPILRDPGLAPDGAKCAPDMMCKDQKCIPISDVLFDCPYNCSNNGVCNNVGNCHCNDGYEAPYCDVAGPGGSINSGPASDPTGQFLAIIYIFFFAIVPALIILAVCIFCRKKISKSKFNWLPNVIPNKLSSTKPSSPPKVRKPLPFHILPTNSVRNPKTQNSEVKLTKIKARKSTKKGLDIKKPTRQPPPPPPTTKTDAKAKTNHKSSDFETKSQQSSVRPKVPPIGGSRVRSSSTFVESKTKFKVVNERRIPAVKTKGTKVVSHKKWTKPSTALKPPRVRLTKTIV